MTSQEAKSPVADQVEVVWQRVRERLKLELGAQRFQYWIDPLRLVAAKDGRVVIACNSHFERDKIVEGHGERIANMIAEMIPAFGAVEFVVDMRPRAAQPVNPVRPTTADVLPVELPLVEGSSPLNPAYTFESFVIGRTNQIAFHEARRVAESDVPVANPLFLFGATGLGKSHLMHAIARQKLLRNPSLRVMLISAENFMRLFITAIKANDTLSFKNLVRNVDVLLIDDLHFLIGKEATQEELVAALDSLLDQQKQIILSADRSPSLFESMSDRARSRLMSGASIEIQATDFELRLAILESKARQMAKERPGFVLNSEAAHFMAQRIATNTRELEGALTRVVTQSSDGSRPVTIENLNVWLADFLRAYDRRVTIEEIKKKVAEHYGLKVAELESPNRSRSIVRPRQIAMYLARLLTPRSYPEIGRRFGNRDHTTVMHAVETIQRLTSIDPTFAEEVERLRLSIRNWPVDGGTTPPRPPSGGEGPSRDAQG
ncbi:MAG: chromosomal replication initiator protein DnaA [Alphaproteobacteria bacterium]|nr:chromosomal replication initiator protein DnaA [Alphaproteobacteria bacterium]